MTSRRRRWISAASGLLAVVGLTAAIPSSAAAAGLTFSGQLTGLDCVNTATCYAVGTTQGHSALLTIDRPTLGITSIRNLPDTMLDISCATERVCYAAGVDAPDPDIYDEVLPHVAVVKIVDGVAQATHVLAAQMDTARISCGGVTHCLVVGDTTIVSSGSSVNSSGLVVWLHGTTARSVIPSSDTKYDASCYTATTCVTVGEFDTGDNEDGFYDYPTIDTLTEGMPNRNGASQIFAHSVSCLPNGNSAECEAAGSGDDAQVVRFAAGSNTYDTTSTGIAARFNDVDCAGLTVCVAAGSRFSGSAPGAKGAVVAKFNGTTFTGSTTYPAANGLRSFDRVSCGGELPCVAIDDQYVNAMPTTTLKAIG